VSALDAYKLQVKLFVAGSASELALAQFIPVFHDWIKHHRLPEPLIDVANYAHVPRGPGVALIGHQADYFIDEADARPGLLYSRKREPPAPAERLPDAFRRVLHAAVMLENDPSLSGMRFRTDELFFRINDRLLAPPGEATFTTLRPALDGLCARLFAGAPYQLSLTGGPRELFSVLITSSAPADTRTLLDRLGGPIASQ
jgi:hypothetical protein